MDWKDGPRPGEHAVSEPYSLVTDPLAACSLNK